MCPNSDITLAFITVNKFWDLMHIDMYSYIADNTTLR